MKKQNTQLFKIFTLIVLGSIVGLLSLFGIIKLIIVSIQLEAFFKTKGMQDYHFAIIFILLILLIFIIEIFLNKKRKKALPSIMTEEERKKYEEESFRIRWWHESLCYIVCIAFIEVIVELFIK